MSFSKAMKSLQKKLEINNLQLNGSFQHSLFATDIDFYERTNNLSAVIRKLRVLNKLDMVVDLIKVMPKHIGPRGGGKRTFREPKKAVHYLREGREIAWIRIEGAVMFMLYPMECSVIYDLSKHTGKEILDDVLSKVAQKKYGAYKLCKRGLLLAKLLKQQGVDINTEPFQRVLDDQRLGQMNLHATHLKSIKHLGIKIPKERVFRMLNTIAEDLRRLNAPMNHAKLLEEVNSTARKMLIKSNSVR